jgi:hypothetical protein
MTGNVRRRRLPNSVSSEPQVFAKYGHDIRLTRGHSFIERLHKASRSMKKEKFGMHPSVKNMFIVNGPKSKDVKK